MLPLLPFRRRGALLIAAFLAADAGFAIAACSSSSPDDPAAADGSTESAAGDAAKDSPIVKPDGGGSEGGVGNCSPANTKCDLVLQDCPAQQECVVSSSNGTECRAVEASQQLPLGRACCPGTSSNPCLPGLSCVGQPCTDAGTTTARCSPACCKGNDQACGKSDPEGISGACDLTLVDTTTSTPLHDVCTYRTRCKPFKAEPCKAGETCLVEDKAGTATCIDSFGKTNRQSCSFANEGADGFIGLGGADAGPCHTVCLLPGAVHPFDASVEMGGPGLGGCPASETCDLRITDRPDWFAACSLDGG